MELSKKSESWKADILVVLLVIVAVGYFIFTLGFMTSFYDFFYAGTEETFSFYKELQVVNHYIFKSSLVLIVITVFCMVTGCQKKPRNWLVLGVLAGAIVYLGYTLSVLFQTLPYFENWFYQLDLSTMGSHQLAPLLFKVVYVFPILALLIISLMGWNNFRHPRIKEVFA